MRTRISCKQVDNLTPQEYNVVANLAFRGIENSGLRPQLEFYRHYSEYVAYAYLLRDEDDKILSWALVYPNIRPNYIPESQWKKYHNWEAMFWTRHGYRNRGFGTRICNRLLRDFGPKQIGVYPHNKVAEGLFYKYDNKHFKWLE